MIYAPTSQFVNYSGRTNAAHHIWNHQLRNARSSKPPAPRNDVRFISLYCFMLCLSSRIIPQIYYLYSGFSTNSISYDQDGKGFLQL
jgi:hypothetical protein